MTVSRLRCVILAAGMGTRLGLPEPKPLATLSTGSTIMERQLDYLRRSFGQGVDITIVLGHLAERFDFLGESVNRVINPDFASTNTSKSLLIALEHVGPGPVLWMNGDVIFHESVLDLCHPQIDADKSFMVVNEAETADEEVKYRVSAGSISEVGKGLSSALGEAVGINYVAEKHRRALIAHLRAAEDSDFFEAAIQSAISSGDAEFVPVVIPEHDAIEVDTREDFDVAESRLRLHEL